MAYFPEMPNESDQLMDDISSFPEFLPGIGVEQYPIAGEPIDIDPNVELPPFYANVEFLNLERDQMFEKVQCRKGGVARQVLEDADIRMKAVFNYGQLTTIHGWIRRVGDGNTDVPLMNTQNEMMNLAENFTNQEHGSIPVPEVIDGQQFYTLSFSVDLGEIHEGKKAFQLKKNETATKNRFQLIIQLNFFDGPVAFQSPIFRCKTKTRDRKDQQKEAAPPSESSPRLSNFANSPFANSPCIESMSLITDNLKAHTAKIDDLVVDTLETNHADIAYHLKIKDEDVIGELEEGDIVGFFTDQDTGETYVKLLQSDNASDAVHAGVVSRSYYLAANSPKDEAVTETVCVVGMVDVKVIGSVENSERVYASIDRPGKAIPQSHLPVGSFLRRRHVLLGMSMERKIPKSLEEAHLVRCFVCIVLDVGRKEILDEVERVYEVTEKSTEDQIRYASKKAWRRVRCCTFMTLLIVGLLLFVLYQVFVPGSMFRYWLCRRGSVTGELRVSVWPYSSKTTRIRVHGTRFTFDGLGHKVSDHFTRNKKASKDHSGTYYFLNLDRCAYFGDKGPVRNYFDSSYKDIGGGKILSTDQNCTTVYWYGLHPHHPDVGIRWWPYVSQRNLTCSPDPPYS